MEYYTKSANAVDNLPPVMFFISSELAIDYR